MVDVNSDKVTDVSGLPAPEIQSGLLDLDVELSSPQLYSGAEFSLYLRIRNPFNRPVWVHEVTTSLPRQMYCRVGEQSSTEAFPGRRRLDIEKLSSEAERTAQDISNLESEVEKPDASSDLKARLAGRRERLQWLRARLGLVWLKSEEIRLESGDFATGAVHIESRDLRIGNLRVQAHGQSDRVALASGALPKGRALQPGSTDVWTIVLGTSPNPLFIPARYRLQFNVVFSFAKPQENDVAASMHVNTAVKDLQIRAAIWAIMTGAVAGGILGAIAREFQQSSAASGSARVAIFRVLLTALLCIAATLFTARKTDVQTFVSVEDFWGGALTGFLVGFSGNAFFSKFTGQLLTD